MEVDPRQAALGQLLFYDKILSGNKNIACGTCHHPRFGSSDGLSLGIGEGGEGLGPDRTPGTGATRIHKRIPRNAPALWNLGAAEIAVLMHDGRVSQSDLYGNGFDTPAEERLPRGLASVVAAQALFPMTSEAEMAGDPEENEIGGAINDRLDRGWAIIAKRVRVIPEYGARFTEAFDHIETPEEITIVEIANALAAFISVEFRSIDSPFDAYLRGDETALGDKAKSGMALFFGEAGCSGCHAGPMLSDHKFRALGLPAFGPGRTRPFDPIARDLGRLGESDDLADAYRFRTPMLRNVALTAPYGHNGAYPTLHDMIGHHLDPETARARWTRDLAALPAVDWLAEYDFIIQTDAREMDRQSLARDVYLPARSPEEIDALVAFLQSLTGASTDTTPFGVPDRVPSGLIPD
ncbi:cytochrome-c peroxidase [Poseidonocella sedimentorum]|uniref:Cytochrome c peroxidase n=1 Tax=Poseidonocella sedimentorum TaxID=871652 RepID=A0A1I6D2S5_9RHOB|nr:cytochrome c peroxidase [Poseidonocella sedimentorum]SFQ99710.1 cytochrome c peroxidase [Poseidonocella sedimentorum]